MAWLKLVPWQKVFAITLVFVIASFLIFPLTPTAQANIWDNFKSIFEPLTDALPTGNSGAAGRGPSCAPPAQASGNQADHNQPAYKVIALVPPAKQRGSEDNSPEDNNPEDNNPEDSPTGNQPAETSPSLLSESGRVGGLTIAAQPTFWFYVPYTLPPDLSTPEASSKLVAQFVLLDESDHPVWNELMAVELSNHPQLVEYPLSHALETDKPYKWYFSVICDSEKLSRNPVVRGWVQRVEPMHRLQAALRNAPPFKQYLVYLENGIWFDTVSSLVKIRRQFPSTNREDWLSLLDSFGIPRVNQFDGLEPVEPIELEEVKGNQFPAST